MTRVSRTDTLLTELRDVKRRLRLLEAARMRGFGATGAMLAPQAGPREPMGDAAFLPVPLPPARPVDWPATTSADWERLAAVRLQAAYAGPVAVQVTVVAEPGTSGAVRVLLGDVPVGEDLPADENITTRTLPVPGHDTDVEIVVAARRLAGAGTVRAVSVLVGGIAT